MTKTPKELCPFCGMRPQLNVFTDEDLGLTTFAQIGCDVCEYSKTGNDGDSLVIWWDTRY